jgi:endoglycosylceramidase
VCGTHFVTQYGDYVTFHGVDYTGIEVYDLFSDNPSYQTPKDYEIIASWGFNLVRLPIGWNHLEPQPGVYNASYLNLVKDIVKEANSLGIYVVLDMVGAPAWTGGWQPDSIWYNSTLIDNVASTWGYVASSFSNDPGVLGYDIYNEPLAPPPPNWSEAQVYSAIARLDNACVASIRKVDARHIIFYESGHSAASVHPNYWVEPNDPSHQLVIEVHDYGVASNQAGSAAILSAAVNASRSWGVPVIVGEFGYTHDVSYLYSFVKSFDQLGLSWCYWTYGVSTPSSGSPAEFATFDSNGQVDPIVPYALEEPYPQLSSSPLSSLSVQRSAFSRAVTVKAEFSSPKGWALFFIPYGYSNPPGSFNETTRLLNVTYSNGQVALNLEGPPVNWAYALGTAAVYIITAVIALGVVAFIAGYVRKKGVESLKRSLESARKPSTSA